MKRLNKILLLSLVMTFAIILICNAQQPNKSQLKSRKIALITTRLELSPTEAQKFWPVFNEYDQKKDALSAERVSLNEKYTTKGASLSSAEVDKIIERLIFISKQEALIFETYNKKFREVLPAHKVMKLYHTETEFKVILLRGLKSNSKGDSE